MSASVLVAYASRYGSTQEVAEAVAATLRECGLEVRSSAHSASADPRRVPRDCAGSATLYAPLAQGRA